MKRLLTLLLTLVLAFSLTITSFAAESGDIGIKGLDTEFEVINYALESFQKHLHSLIESGELSGSIEDYSLGEAFTVFNVKESTNSNCFPVLANGRIVAIFEVFKLQGEYNSSLAISFAKELEEIVKSNTVKNFALLTDGIHLQAFDGEQSVEIFKLYDDGNEVGDLYVKSSLSLSSLPKTSTQSDIRADLKAYTIMNNGFSPMVIDGPTSYKTLNVQGVSQGNHPWCWAATCAAMINYLRGEYLTASDVANYVFPDNPEQGGNWDDMKKAYNHWRLYPSYGGVISFSRVQGNINSGDPMHIRLDGHSVGLIGYEDWVGSVGGNNERILILLEPNGGVHKSVTLNSSGNFYYALGGGSNAWRKTIEF